MRSLKGIYQWVRGALQNVALPLHKRYNQAWNLQHKNQSKIMAKQTTVLSVSFLQRLGMFIVTGFVVGSLISTLSIFGFLGAQSIEELRQRSAELETEIKENTQRAEELNQEAATLQDVIRSYDNQIQQANQQIAFINNEIARLEKELDQAEEDLERQKELLRRNMRALYVRGGASTIELLAASESFSEFIDEQEYLERLKTAIHESTRQVIALQEQIEDQKDEQESLLVQEEETRRSLNATRSQRAGLLEQTQGMESEYRRLVEQLKQQRAEAEKALARALAARSFQTAPVGPVAAGEVVGGIGNTGLSSGPHLHLELRVNGSDTNPIPYIKHQPVDIPPAWVSQGYGRPASLYARGYHPGIDYAGPLNSPIRAIDDGYLYRGCSRDLLGTATNAYGYVALVEHNNGSISIYAHMSGGPPACNYNISPW